MAVNKWYPLPEVNPKEEGWWEEERAELLSDIKAGPTTSASLTVSPFQCTSIIPPVLERGGTPPTDLSISTLLTTACTSLAPSSPFDITATSEFSHEITDHYTRKGVKVQTAKHIPCLEAMTELDGLWKKFLSSSIAGKENKGMAKCTCIATQHKARMKRGLVTDFTNEMTSSKIQHLQTRSILIERAVQTSPLLTQPVHRQCSVPPPPPVMFTVASSYPAKTQATELSLSEALALSRPEFIEASLKRQREIKRWQRLHIQCNQIDVWPNKHQPRRQTSCTNGPLNSATPRTRMSKLEMYKASKRVWSQLPEVQARKLAEKRKSQAETNRLRVKLYQQEVLSRMRRLNKK